MPFLLFFGFEFLGYYSLSAKFGFWNVFWISFFITVWGMALLGSPSGFRKIAGFLFVLPFLTTRFLGFILLIPGLRQVFLWILSLKFMKWLQTKVKVMQAGPSSSTFGDYFRFKVFSSDPASAEFFKDFINKAGQKSFEQGPMRDVQGQERDVSPHLISTERRSPRDS
jgi:hypothetical protein